jgi:hypothetical protein
MMVGLVGVDKAKHRLKGPHDARKARPPRRRGSVGGPPAGRRPDGHKTKAVPSARR